VSPATRFSPYYRWLAETLREDISQGIYKPGDTLPTEHELMRRYVLSSTTVRRAVQDLVREGLIYRQAGKGTFVKRSKIEEHLLHLTSFAEEMQSRNIKPNFKLVQAKSLVPPTDIARVLGLARQEQVFYIERIQYANRELIALAQGYWRGDIGEKLAQQDLNEISLYETLEQQFHIPLVEAEESIGAVSATTDVARKLKIRKSAPLLARHRLTFTSEMRPVEYTTTLYRADRYEYKVRLPRRSI
jgi:GntR family transcriptional regulator